VVNRISRRTFLIRSIQLPIGGSILLGLGACDGNEGGLDICADSNAMTSAEQSMRLSLNYQEISSNPDEVCVGCAFFHAGQRAGACGPCEIFNGQSANPLARCDSWSAGA